ncbi:helix-turn-helix domain-containing protein [Streptomyces sp. SHP 1-2]|uniref:helix-turn-helix domain-containing protein n=1 Tax=Streptomyces sp. SHP 1-2 TaxID=2769489 RepID=UPI0022387DC4|nr:helix-turn-helix transcriptional regulator [Streptomyces sp. SHP 1-2]
MGTALRAYRLAAKLDQPQAAEVIASSQARISRMESGRATPRVIEVRLLLDAYGVTDSGVREKLEELAKHSKKRGWWLEYAGDLRPDYLDYIAMEDDAVCIRQWQPVLVPGLLQTAAYSKAVVEGGPNTLTPERVSRLVEVRRRRQKRVVEGEVKYSAVLWEATIEYPLMDTETHLGQLSAILEFAGQKNVDVHILPFGAGTLTAAFSAFSAFSFDSESEIEAVAMDDVMNSSVIESRRDLDSYSSSYDMMLASSLTPEESMKLVRRKLESLGKGEK